MHVWYQIDRQIGWILIIILDHLNARWASTTRWSWSTTTTTERSTSPLTSGTDLFGYSHLFFCSSFRRSLLTAAKKQFKYISGADGEHGWYRSGSNDNQLCERKCYWFHEAIYEPRHIHPFQGDKKFWYIEKLTTVLKYLSLDITHWLSISSQYQI